MYALLALVSALITAGSFYFYVNRSDGNILYFILAIVFLVLTLIFGGLFLSSRVNRTEDIHITE